MQHLKYLKITAAITEDLGAFLPNFREHLTEEAMKVQSRHSPEDSLDGNKLKKAVLQPNQREEK